MEIVSFNDLIWIVSIFGSCIITIYLAFVSKTKKKKIIFTLLAIIPTFLCVVFIPPLLENIQCRSMKNDISQSLKMSVMSHSSLPLDIEFGGDRCAYYFWDALEDGAINQKDQILKKRYVCILFGYDMPRNIEANMLKVILPKVFYKNPIHSIQCLNTNKSGFHLLRSGLSLSLNLGFKNINGEKLGMSESKFNTVCDELEKSQKLTTEDKKKVKLLRKEVMESFRAEQKPKEGKKK